MDRNKLVRICELYDQELKLLDEYNENLNNVEKYNQFKECHEKCCGLLKNQTLASVFEQVRGLDNPTTIDLYFEEAEKLEENYKEIIPIYEHALAGCRALYGEYGEKTIECRLQIAICIRNLCEQRDNGQGSVQEQMTDDEYSFGRVLQILEELFVQHHEHSLYGTLIPVMLSDEYVRMGNKKRAMETFAQWKETHPIDNIHDIEELNAWIEYTLLLAEVGWPQEAIKNAEHFRQWMRGNLSEQDSLIPYLYRRISEIYVSCTLYNAAIDILESVRKDEGCYPKECEEEFMNIKAQLAHAYYLNGNQIEAAVIGFELQQELSDKKMQHPSKYQFDNILSNILGSLGDHFEQYDKIFSLYKESRLFLGENNDETVLYEMNLGNACFEIYHKVDGDEKGKYINDAEYYLQDAYEHSVIGRRKGNPFSLLIKRNLAEVQAEKGDIFTAIRTLEEVWHKSAEIFSEDNPETADVKLRYAALCLETQQGLMDTPEWLDEVDTEPILEACFLTKKKFLGMKHRETIDALYWYARAVQSNELIDWIQRRNTENIYRKSIKLHRLLFLNIEDMLEQAFYINSIEKQNEYMDILEYEFTQMFWMLINSIGLDMPIDLEEFYDLIGGCKNLSYDMQCYKLLQADDKMRKKFAETLSADIEVVEYLYRNENYSLKRESLVKQVSDNLCKANEIFIDIWQAADSWNVFFISENGISYKCIDWLPDEDVPYIEESFDLQQHLDEMDYTLEECLKWASYIAEHLAEEMKGYSKAYLNLHKQTHQFPIASFIYELTGISVITVSSVYQLLKQKKEDEIAEIRIGFIENSVSLDRQIVKDIFQNTKGSSMISGEYNIISISGHGIYIDDAKIPEGKKNYIQIEANCRLYVQDVISEDLSNVELAFLPVCQSGNGTDYYNFGTYSMGKAFRMAGVGYTIETLWDVSLSASLIFEYEFFRFLKETGIIDTAFYCAVQSLKNYTADDLGKFCRFIMRISGNKQLVRILYSEKGNGDYPFKAASYWSGFCLQKGEG